MRNQTGKCRHRKIYLWRDLEELQFIFTALHDVLSWVYWKIPLASSPAYHSLHVSVWNLTSSSRDSDISFFKSLFMLCSATAHLGEIFQTTTFLAKWKMRYPAFLSGNGKTALSCKNCKISCRIASKHCSPNYSIWEESRQTLLNLNGLPLQTKTQEFFSVSQHLGTAQWWHSS